MIILNESIVVVLEPLYVPYAIASCGELKLTTGVPFVFSGYPKIHLHCSRAH